MNIVLAILSVIGIYILLMLSGFHTIKEGYVGLYKHFGVLQKNLAAPGIHFMVPFYSECIPIKIKIQTDVVRNIPCGTADGTLIEFQRIQVVNQLKEKHVYKTILNYTEDYEKLWISDKVHHEINQFCSKHTLQQIYIDIFQKLDQQLTKALNKDLKKWAPGINIISIRITKPSIPERIRENFEEMQKKKVDYYLTVERQKVKVEEQMTKQKQQIIKANSGYEVKKIELEKMIKNKQNQKKMSLIQAQMIYEKAKTQVDAQFIAYFEEANLYSKLYTQEYLLLLASQAFTTNVQFKLGNKLPKAMLGKI